MNSLPSIAAAANPIGPPSLPEVPHRLGAQCRRSLLRRLFASDWKRLGVLVAPRWQVVLGWSCAAIILALNLKVLTDTIFGD